MNLQHPIWTIVCLLSCTLVQSTVIVAKPDEIPSVHEMELVDALDRMEIVHTGSVNEMNLLRPTSASHHAEMLPNSMLMYLKARDKTAFWDILRPFPMMQSVESISSSVGRIICFRICIRSHCIIKCIHVPDQQGDFN
ncbi:unnamed protein product [Calicophoron daubneyi]|uniref:Melanin-concentrating hormone n=1 Tax=Calicophoron daubneyi TaxID=300641 RepID=A0AAV2TZ51_CALDB